MCIVPMLYSVTIALAVAIKAGTVFRTGWAGTQATSWGTAYPEQPAEMIMTQRLQCCRHGCGLESCISSLSSNWGRRPRSCLSARNPSMRMILSPLPPTPPPYWTLPRFPVCCQKGRMDRQSPFSSARRLSPNGEKRTSRSL